MVIRIYDQGLIKSGEIVNINTIKAVKKEKNYSSGNSYYDQKQKITSNCYYSLYFSIKSNKMIFKIF